MSEQPNMQFYRDPNWQEQRCKACPIIAWIIAAIVFVAVFAWMRP